MANRDELLLTAERKHQSFISRPIPKVLVMGHGPKAHIQVWMNL